MKEICIHIPSLRPDDIIEVDVRVGGQQHHLHYRVETFDWNQGRPSEERIEQLRIMIQSHDPAWELVQIGVPDGHFVPVMFRQRRPPHA
jgi:hypothetical protein